MNFNSAELYRKLRWTRSISVIVGPPALLECGVDEELIPDITCNKDGDVLDPRESSNIR